MCIRDSLRPPLRVGLHCETSVGISPVQMNKQAVSRYTCNCKLIKETTLHFLMKCSNFNKNRRDLLQTVNSILLANNINRLNDNELIHLFLLYGHEKLKFYENQTILEVTIKFIKKSMRFSSP